MLLGCTPFLDDYGGSVDLVASSTRRDPVLDTVSAGGIVGEEALLLGFGAADDGAPPARALCAVVSDDGHDDVITTNHFVTIRRAAYRAAIDTFYHPRFRCLPTDANLDASWTELGDAGARRLCAHLIHSRNRCLTVLDLRHNGIGPDGARALAVLLRAGAAAALERVDLSHNRAGDEGAEALADSLLAGVGALMSLALRANGLTERGAAALREAARDNASLASLDLGDVDPAGSAAIGPPSVRVLSRVVRKMCAI